MHIEIKTIHPLKIINCNNMDQPHLLKKIIGCDGIELKFWNNYPDSGCGLHQFATRIAVVEWGRLMTFTVQNSIKHTMKYPW